MIKTGKKIEVLIVDDSAVVRQVLSGILKSDPEIEVIGTASDPYEAVKHIKIKCPDVLTLDIEMPGMDGLTFLRKIMSQHPIPVVIVSRLTASNPDISLKAMEYGAVDVISKPVSLRESLEEIRIVLCDKVKAAAISKISRIKSPEIIRKKTITKKPGAEISPKVIKPARQVVLIGASTGGTNAVKDILINLPADSPGIVVVQHMPEHFTRAFADMLNGICKISVKEAEDGDKVITGKALIAPGNRHLKLKKNDQGFYVEVRDGELFNRHKPSVDVLFFSAAKVATSRITGILLTGMGRDGAEGLLEMKNAGANTVAQDEQSSVVFGMPKAAIDLKAADVVLPLFKIANYIRGYLNN